MQDLRRKELQERRLEERSKRWTTNGINEIRVTLLGISFPNIFFHFGEFWVTLPCIAVNFFETIPVLLFPLLVTCLRFVSRQNSGQTNIKSRVPVEYSVGRGDVYIRGSHLMTMRTSGLKAS